MDFIEYGADGHKDYEDKPVRERFRTPAPVEDPDYFSKIFCKCSRIDKFNTHYPEFCGDRFRSIETDKDDEDGIYLEHYYTKSFKEFKTKILKELAILNGHVSCLNSLDTILIWNILKRAKKISNNYIREKRLQKGNKIYGWVTTIHPSSFLRHHSNFLKKEG